MAPFTFEISQFGEYKLSVKIVFCCGNVEANIIFDDPTLNSEWYETLTTPSQESVELLNSTDYDQEYGHDEKGHFVFYNYASLRKDSKFTFSVETCRGRSEFSLPINDKTTKHFTRLFIAIENGV